MTQEAGERLLVDVLPLARDRGLVGPAPLDQHVRHAEGFLVAAGTPPKGDDMAVDLGSGGGLPGLVLALRWPDSRWVLLDSRRRACRFLREATDRLGIQDRVEVECARAEQVGRSGMRGRAALVVARAFGAPAVVAECAAPLLSVGGRLVVSSPPERDPAAWPPSRLDELGLGAARRTSTGEASYVVLRQERLCPERFPRRPGIPAKRLLF